jgi:hypothetical protein
MSSWDPYDLLGKAWILLVGLLAFIGKRHFDDDRAIARRLARVEQQHATREDVQRIETAVSELRNTVSENHTQILNTLLAQNAVRDHR